MTLAPSDSPDWLGVPGAYRYLGALSVTGPGNDQDTLDFTPASYDGAVVVIPVTLGPGAITDLNVRLLQQDLATVMDEMTWLAVSGVEPRPFVGFVSRALGATWRVELNLSAGVLVTAQAYVFAAPAFPITYAVNNTHPQTVQGSTNGLPVPVTIEGQSPVVLVRYDPIGQAALISSVPVAIASDQAIGRAGQQAMAGSAPVVLASDQSTLPVEQTSAGPIEVLAGAVRNATTESAEFRATQYTGMVFTLSVAANPGGAETLSLRLRASLGGGNSVDVVDLGIMVTAANGGFVAVLAPGITAADYNGGLIVAGKVKQVRVPSAWRALVVHSGAGNWTYSLTGTPIP